LVENHPVASQQPMGRRDFLSVAGKTWIAALGLGALATSVGFVWPQIKAGPGAQILLGRLSDFKMRTLTWLKKENLFVMRDERGIGAFSCRCTHLGCVVQRVEAGFVCPCHGARFDGQGRVLAGPARRSLPWYRVFGDSDGRFWVNVAEEVPPGAAPIEWNPEASVSGDPA
jgi:cytochrome b6-f complex iron-sulfur subunit